MEGKPNMIYTTKPTPARLLHAGDTFRDGGQTYRILEARDREIVYSPEHEDRTYSFFPQPDDIFDRIIDG